MPYTVSSGDTLQKISVKMNVPLTDLIAANPQISNPDVIEVGDVVNLPGEKTSTDQALSGWCSFVLENTGSRVPEPGVSLVLFPVKKHVFVATMSMPAPSSFGQDYNIYTAWIASSTSPLEIKDFFDLIPTVEPGFWVNHKDIPSLGPSDYVLVSPEARGHGPRPVNPVVVLSGNLSRCCRK